ncbi:MAG: hypothetical protein ACT4O9_09895 [Blastocatellia bacterium]
MVICIPVWGVEYFINQDGSGHIHSAFLMAEMLKGNPMATSIYEFNSFSVPNSTGHWILVLLLQVFDPFVATKILISVLFVGLVATVAWLRYVTAGSEGVKTSMLIAAAAGFNWLWLVGFYNFLIGVIVLVIGIAVFYRWGDILYVRRGVFLTVLFLLTYYSHVVSFGILLGSVVILACFAASEKRKSSIGWVLASILPIVPLATIYRSVTAGGGGYSPVWRSLNDTGSITNWINQIRLADPFIIISRKSLPFVDGQSDMYAIFTPLLWISVALIVLMIPTIFEWKRNREEFWRAAPFVFLVAFSVLFVMFAPDDFGTAHGGVLRERVALCSLIFFVPIFRLDNGKIFRRIGQTLLIFVIVFQTVALWDYAIRTDDMAREYYAANSVIRDQERIASVTIINDSMKFHSLPSTQMNNFHRIGRNITVWDNYEIGHFLFPIKAKTEPDKQFVLDLTSSNAFLIYYPSQNFRERILRFESLISNDGGRIDALFVWGRNQELDNVLEKYFKIEPDFESANLRLLRRKK